jgi:KDO2-lipid IV(A) lauroyltransferase
LQFLAYILLVGFVYPLSLLPLPVLYVLSDVGFVVLRYVLRYRVSVVRDNLQRAFPNAGRTELKGMTNRYYRHLAEITIEGVKALSISRRQLMKRVSIRVSPEVDGLFANGTHVIVASSHFGNWEWSGLALSVQSAFQVVGLYLPHRNPFIRRGMVRRRQRFGMLLVAPDEVRRFFARYEGKPTMTVFIADQAPGNPNKAYWVNFMNRQTAFLVGPGKMSAGTGRPLLFGKAVRLKRGYHRVEIDVLDAQPQHHSPEDLTQQFAQRLEHEIRQKPEHWLWSHRRWKHSKD